MRVGKTVGGAVRALRRIPRSALELYAHSRGRMRTFSRRYSVEPKGCGSRSWLSCSGQRVHMVAQMAQVARLARIGGCGECSGCGGHR